MLPTTRWVDKNCVPKTENCITTPARGGHIFNSQGLKSVIIYSSCHSKPVTFFLPWNTKYEFCQFENCYTMIL